MSRRLLLDELRRVLLDEVVGNDWKTPSECADELGLGLGYEWIRVSLLLERAANDGILELKNPGGRTRRFRLRRREAA